MIEKVDQINEALVKSRNAIVDLCKLLDAEGVGMTYRMIQDDIQHARKVREQIMMDNDSMRVEGQRIVEEAKARAAEFTNRKMVELQQIEFKRLEMIQKLDQVNAFVDEVDKKRSLQHLKNIKETILPK